MPFYGQMSYRLIPDTVDGISQPAIRGFQDPLPGQQPTDAGAILLGQTGDDTPAWAKDGSFMAFRQLQYVPAFLLLLRLVNIMVTDNSFQNSMLSLKLTRLKCMA